MYIPLEVEGIVQHHGSSAKAGDLYADKPVDREMIDTSDGRHDLGVPSPCLSSSAPRHIHCTVHEALYADLDAVRHDKIAPVQ